MRFRVLVLACAAIAGSVTSAAGRDPIILTPAQNKALVDKANRQSMLFFVANGEANACGPGCSEWIAAEGAFDGQAGKRFQEFVEKLPRRDLPVYFNSIGGQTQQASLIALVLRTNRMRAGVARTVPEGCNADVASDPACRRLVQSKQGINARLVTKGAKCQSACNIAFIGGSARQVAADAQFGIHAFVIAGAGHNLDEWRAIHRRLFIWAGVEPGFFDLISSVPRMRPLSREEIARFGLETRGFYETRWFVDRKASPNLMEQLSIRKSVTQEEKDGSGEYRAAQLLVLCSLREPHLLYRREMWKNENSGGASVNLGGNTLQFVSVSANEKDIDARVAKVNYELLRKAAAEQAIEITGLFSADGELRPRITRISTAGLSSGLDAFTKHCVGSNVSAPSAPPAQAVAR